MKVMCLGGGPAGLYFAISMKLRDPNHDVTVLERNKANDTFGWGTGPKTSLIALCLVVYLAL